MNAAVDYFRDEPAMLRVPPQSIEAEQAVLGGLMLAPVALAKISDWLTADDFLRADHRLIYAGILALCEADRPCDAVTLGDWFEAQGQLDQVDGGAYLIDLARTTPSAANIVAYAEIVRDKSLLRQAIDSAVRLQNDCFQPNGRDTAEIISTHAHEITQLRGDPRAGGLVLASSGLNDWFDDLQVRYSSGNRVTGLPYPWTEINDVTHGLQPGELTIIAGRPSMGKSIMGLNLALFSAMRQRNTQRSFR
jgi:replicative DNA helicase